MSTNHQPILSYQKLSYLRWYNQEEKGLIPLGLTAAVSAADAGIHKKY